MGELIRSGCVTIDGLTVRDPGLDYGTGAVAANGEAVAAPSQLYLMLHKPSGILTQAEGKNARSVVDLLPERYRKAKCMPVGRLDKDTTGLLLLTTDGVLAHRLIAPKRHVDKVYRAWTDADLNGSDIEAFASGMHFAEFDSLPARLEIVSPREGIVTVREGKYHQVKRMFAARGKQVIRLHREVFGPLHLDTALSPGAFRNLDAKEVEALYAAAEMEMP